MHNFKHLSQDMRLIIFGVLLILAGLGILLAVF